jgi:predicted small lipoprotein YifL
VNVRSKIISQEFSNKNHLYFYLKILTVLFLVISLSCCGKKGPPIPPDTPSLFPVTKVDAKLLDDNVLELSWIAQAGKGASVPDGFRIYRSKQSLADPECPGCPDVFEMVSELTVAFSLWGWTERQVNYHETLEDGYIYRYKVMAYTYSGLTSEWSNTVEVVVE